MSSAAGISQLLATKQILTYIKKSFPGVDRRPSFIIRAEKFYLENEARQNILFKVQNCWKLFCVNNV